MLTVSNKSLRVVMEKYLFMNCLLKMQLRAGLVTVELTFRQNCEASFLRLKSRGISFASIYKRNGSTYRTSEKKLDQPQPLLPWGKEIWWTLVHNRKSSIGAYWPSQVNILRETTFRPLLPPQIFTRVRYWKKNLLVHTPTGTGSPQRKIIAKI